jgi:hypothetical protein
MSQLKHQRETAEHNQWRGGRDGGAGRKKLSGKTNTSNKKIDFLRLTRPKSMRPTKRNSIYRPNSGVF